MTSPNRQIRAEIGSHLGRYVYLLVDPRDGMPFYVGKGTGSRAEDHGLTAEALSEDASTESNSAKIGRINQIRNSGHEVDIWILRRGMTAAEYSAVEATIIDLLTTFLIAPSGPGQPPLPLQHPSALTNAIRGANIANGITKLADIIRDKSATPLTTTTPLLLITLKPWVDLSAELPNGHWRDGFGFKPEWTDRTVLEPELETLGESVCCWWGISPQRVSTAGIEHIVAVYQGVTRGLFRIIPNSEKTIPSTTSTGKPATRSGFAVTPVLDGPLWNETIGEFGHRVTRKRGEQSPVRYWPHG